MLTVLHTESSLGWGGQENRTLYECVGLKALGARVIVLTKPEARLAEKARSAGLEVRTHPMRSNRDIPALLYLLNLIKAESIDVISTHSGDDSFLGAVAGRLSSRRPSIVRTRHLALPISSRFTYAVLPHMVVTVSGYVRKYLVEEKGVRPDKVVSIPTGIDLKRFNPAITPDTFRAELALPKEALIAGTVAILRRKKGHHILLEAIPEVLKEVPEAFFVFAGDGPQRQNIEDKIKELGIGRSVRLLGLRTDIPAILKGLDVFVLPTLQEALGTSFLEASAMGKPAIGTKVGGVPEAVLDGVTGLLVEPSDPKGLANALIRLLKDPILRARLGAEGRLRAERECSMDVMVKRMFELYKSLARQS